MDITARDVEHVAMLARLELSAREKELFAGQLGAILRYIEKLNELDTEGVEPTSHVLPISNVMRDDAPRPSWPLDRVLDNAPDKEDGQFRVPSVLE
jgi:aspartyl-tRNA(Asn)/glutamyl-tRNA(Gln) amidotransferase subunit C